MRDCMCVRSAEPVPRPLLLTRAGQRCALSCVRRLAHWLARLQSVVDTLPGAAARMAELVNRAVTVVHVSLDASIAPPPEVCGAARLVHGR